jgi:hypothetical protein
MQLTRSLVRATLGAAVVAAAPAQVTTVATESFDYPVPGLLINNAGGTGWANPWWVGPNGNEIVIFDQNVQPPFNKADAIGNYLGQGNEFGEAFRMPDTTPHADVVEGGAFGADGATMWFSFATVTYQQFGTHYNGFSLYLQGSGEELFMGSPWDSNAWGIDDTLGNPNSQTLIAGSSDVVETCIVVRVDWLAGDERVRMWLDPAVAHPTTAPGLDVMVPDFRWNEVRFSSGGNAGHGFWDNLVIEKGTPSTGVGTSYCGPAALNSTGSPGVLTALGSDVASANDLTLLATGLPNNQFGYFLNSMSQGFAQPSGSQGFLCVAGQIGRYNASIGNTGGTGGISLVLDLPNTPTPGGPTAVVAGQTWYFQAWYRDVGGTNNFTDGVCIAFQ